MSLGGQTTYCCRRRIFQRAGIGQNDCWNLFAYALLTYSDGNHAYRSFVRLRCISASNCVSENIAPRNFSLACCRCLDLSNATMDSTCRSSASIARGHQPPKVSITLNSDHTQPLVVRMYNEWQEWSANINLIANLVLFARPPSICSIFDTLWQRRITAAFGARPKYCYFSNPRSAAASGSLNIHLA